jgi:Carboxypeptidase regulatory-like domain/IPT/TIG domain
MNLPSHPSGKTLRIISGRKIFWAALIILATAVAFSAALSGLRDRRRRTTTERTNAISLNRVATPIAAPGEVTGAPPEPAKTAGPKRDATLSPQPLTGADTVRQSQKADSDQTTANPEKIERELFVNPLTPLPRTAQVPFSSAMPSGRLNNDQSQDQNPQEPSSLRQNEQARVPQGQIERVNSKPKEERLTKAHTFDGDLRTLPFRRPVKQERPEREAPEFHPSIYSGGPPKTGMAPEAVAPISPSAPAPTPTRNFDGLDFANWGAGHPPDTNGDVGTTYYIQTVNTSIGIFRKSDGVRVAAFTFNSFMSQGSFGNLCDTNNFGDPVVLYDSFEDRWIITDFAFTLDGSGNVNNPPGSFQCFAASKTGDPVSGGWNFYSINTAGGLGDYPKLGVWPDGIYMSVNMFAYASGGAYQNPRVYAFNKAQMYAGAPTVQSVSFDAPSSDFTILPSNARLQTGTPPLGTPNYYVSTADYLNALTVYKFHVDWNRVSLSTFTGPDVPVAATSWPNASVGTAPTPGNSLDTLEIRAMMQNQYANFGGVESLWTTHTVRRQDTGGFAAPRWYQVNVTGGTVAANLPQAATWDPDGANNFYRFMPSLALDRAGDMALGYSKSNLSTNPQIKYAGRLAGDPINTFSLGEQTLIDGTGTQTGSCGGTCTRWGDYSAMSLDPVDGCTFWYTNEYYAVNGLNDLTRIGAFVFPGCTALGSGGTVSGTVTDSATTNPINGATIAFGSRTTTTNASGVYTFSNIPAGTYPSLTASFPGYGIGSTTNIVVSDGVTTTKNFALTAAATSGCPVDTSQADFQTGVGTNVDMTTSPGNVTLLNVTAVDQANTAGTTTGTGFGTPNWTGQTFIPAVTGSLVKVDVQLFCSNGANPCTGPAGNLTLSVRNTSGGVPTGADLATATIPSFTVNVEATFTATFGAPATLTSGTQYALILRPVSNPAAGSYAWIRSSPSTYANGSRVTSTDSGSTWTADTTRDFNFTTYMFSGYSPSGNLISSVKDANPAVGSTPTWSTLSWTATTPASTTLKFQAAASNNFYGPFNFVGPDGTAATFFTVSGASLSQFNGFRYLKYEAYLSTSNSSVTPTLSDVTVCFTDTGGALSINTVAPPAGRTSGGQTVTLTGAFSNLSTVKIGGISVSFTGNASTIMFTTPAHAVGAVQIDLTPTVGSVYSKPNAFAYLPKVFTDDTITVGQTTVKAQHILELRQAVDAMRAVAGLSGAPWTDPALAPGNSIKAIHIVDLRTYLDDAATRLGYSTSAYTDPGLTTGFVIKRIHVEELRQRIRVIAGP